MAAIYIFGAAVTSTLMLMMCLAGGLGVFLSLAVSYLGAVAAMGLIMLARLRATARHGPGAGHEEAGLSPSLGPTA